MKNFGAGLGVFVVCAALSSCSKAPEPEKTPAAKPSPAPASLGFGTLHVTPNSGSGREQMFTVKLERSAGAPAPVIIGLLVTGNNGSNACYGFRVAGTKSILLVNDSGVGSKPLGDAPSVSNKQCDILAGGSSDVSAGEITAQFNMKFHRGFVGPKKLFAIAQDESGAVTTGLQSAGQYTVQ